MTSPISDHSVRWPRFDRVPDPGRYNWLYLDRRTGKVTVVSMAIDVTSRPVRKALPSGEGPPDRMTDIVGGSADRLPEVRTTEHE
jgi:hypothetical protein